MIDFGGPRTASHHLLSKMDGSGVECTARLKVQGAVALRQIESRSENAYIKVILTSINLDIIGRTQKRAIHLYQYLANHISTDFKTRKKKPNIKYQKVYPLTRLGTCHPLSQIQIGTRLSPTSEGDELREIRKLNFWFAGSSRTSLLLSRLTRCEMPSREVSCR